MTPEFGLKLFDQLMGLSPILSYGSEIWSISNNIDELHFIKTLKKTEAEKIHFKEAHTLCNKSEIIC